jgi:hypothetical protein
VKRTDTEDTSSLSLILAQNERVREA